MAELQKSGPGGLLSCRV